MKTNVNGVVNNRKKINGVVNSKKSMLPRTPVIDHKATEPYFIDSENMVDIDQSHRTLYAHANRMEEERIFSGGGNDLESIEKEIKVSSKIDANEVFKKGELFWRAKKLCQEQNKGFQQWIEDKFDFSYPTAVNQMHVFKFCLGYKQVALDVKPAILYKIAAPSFPDELRAWLFEQGNIEKTLTNGECQKLIKKFKEGGIEAIEADVEQINSYRYAYRQVQYTLDLAKGCHIHSEELRVKIENRGERRPTMYFEDRFKTFEPVASEINNNIWMFFKEYSEKLEIVIAKESKRLEEKRKELEI